jgi:hypothetical protein
MRLVARDALLVPAGGSAFLVRNVLVTALADLRSLGAARVHAVALLALGV